MLLYSREAALRIYVVVLNACKAFACNTKLILENSRHVLYTAPRAVCYLKENVKKSALPFR